MKTKGWTLVLTSLCALTIFITNLIGLNMSYPNYTTSLTENILSILVWSYGLYKGCKLLSMHRIPSYEGKPEHETINFSYSLSFWQYFKMSQLDVRHFSFTTLFVVYYCFCLLFFTELAPLWATLLVVIILSFYMLVYVVKYRHQVKGINNIDISARGIILERNGHRSYYRWEEINWTLFFDTYGFLLSNGSAKLLIINLQGAKDTILYYLNQLNVEKQAHV